MVTQADDVNGTSEDVQLDETTSPNDESHSTVDDKQLEAELESVKAELEKEKKHAAELHEMRLRLQAEFENYRRRTRQEMDDVRQLAAGRLVADLLPVVDNLERAISAASKDPQAAGYIQGTELILKQLLEVLSGVGLQPVESVGVPFDPNVHEAVATEQTEDYPPGYVVEELTRGYAINGKILRVGMVKVAEGMDVEEENNDE